MKKTHLAAIFLLCLCLLIIGIKAPKSFGATSSSSGSAGAAAWEARHGVVRILAVSGNEGSTGSGFGVGQVGEATDIFITNWHVVTDSNGEICPDIYILLNNDAIERTLSGSIRINNSEHMVRCEVLGDPVRYPDFAVIRAERIVTERVALPLMSAEKVEPLETVYALGYPGAADSINGDRYLYADTDSVLSTSGTIMKIEEKVPQWGNTKLIIHEAHINHGNSGGPLLTGEGAVIGINTYGSSSEGTDFYYAVVIDYVMAELDSLGISYDVLEPGQADHNLLRIVVPVALAVILILAAALIGGRRLSKRRRQDHEENRRQGYQLTGISGTYAGHSMAIRDRVRLGRREDSNDLVYPANTKGVSGRHCELFVYEEKLYLRDVGSSYGTFYRKQKLQPNQTVQLQIGDIFYLADPQESFRIDESREHS